MSSTFARPPETSCNDERANRVRRHSSNAIRRRRSVGGAALSVTVQVWRRTEQSAERATDNVKHTYARADEDIGTEAESQRVTTCVRTIQTGDGTVGIVWESLRWCIRLVTSVCMWRPRLLVCVNCENCSENGVACLMKVPRLRPHWLFSMQI